MISLWIPVMIGAFAGWRGLFRDPASAIDALNRYALYVAFPCLVIKGLTTPGFQLPDSPAFWAAVPAAFLLATLGLRLLVGARPLTGTLALVTVFGNTAYLGLPFIERVFGPQLMGQASVAVSLFILFSLLFGPTLLLWWAGDTPSPRFIAKKLIKQPLLWAPWIGFGSRLAPEGVVEGLRQIVVPIGASAGPVALFMLGLYLYSNRSQSFRADRELWGHVCAKMLWLPLCMAAVTFGLGLRGETQALLICLASMPVAITTFSISHEFQQGEHVVASAIVLSTLVSIVSLPALMGLLTPLLGL